MSNLVAHDLDLLGDLGGEGIIGVRARLVHHHGDRRFERMRQVAHMRAVARDDLKDGGADHFARTIAAIREMDPSIVVEVLVPDFHAQDWCIQIVLDAGPDIYNHNMETVERLTPLVRSRAKYHTSLRVLQMAKELSPKTVTKSGVMLGLGETEPELFQTMDDLRDVGCEVLTMGQYLRPTPNHLPVVDYVQPERFATYGVVAREKGFLHVASGPLVRSSYHAADFVPVARTPSLRSP